MLARVGRALYEQLFAGYTRKQWVREPCMLAPSVTARIPVRTDEDLRYFTDPFQGVPDRGYTAMVRRILDHPRIEVVLRCDYRELVGSVRFSRMVYTGPLDSFFDGAYGALPYTWTRRCPRALGVARALTRERCRPPSSPPAQPRPVPDVLGPYPDADEVGGDALQRRVAVDQPQRERSAAG